MAVKNQNSKKEALPKKSANGKAAVRAVVVDHPVDGEQLFPGHYAVRIAAEPEKVVEVSINGEEWQPCRASVGYYWYDWQAQGSGEVSIVARSRNGSGRPKLSMIRNCKIAG